MIVIEGVYEVGAGEESTAPRWAQVCGVADAWYDADRYARAGGTGVRSWPNVWAFLMLLVRLAILGATVYGVSRFL